MHFVSFFKGSHINRCLIYSIDIFANMKSSLLVLPGAALSGCLSHISVSQACLGQSYSAPHDMTKFNVPTATIGSWVFGISQHRGIFRFIGKGHTHFISSARDRLCDSAGLWDFPPHLPPQGLLASWKTAAYELPSHTNDKRIFLLSKPHYETVTFMPISSIF